MEGIDCRATEHTTAQLCDVITCIGGKIGGWEKTGLGENWGRHRPQPRASPACVFKRDVADDLQCTMLDVF